MLKSNEIGPQAYRAAMAQFAGAIHVITTTGSAGLRGTTIIAACSVSDSPATVLACLNRENAKNDIFIRNKVFAINTLAAHHKDLSIAFSGVTAQSTDERFTLAEWDTIATGAPTLTDALAVFDCELVQAIDFATHRVLYGEVKGLRVGPEASPLLYHRRTYCVLA